jgi:hypothetical protein
MSDPIKPDQVRSKPKGAILPRRPIGWWSLGLTVINFPLPNVFVSDRSNSRNEFTAFA